MSKDYHEARKQLPEKNEIYQGYLLWINAEILLNQAKMEAIDQQKEKIVNGRDLLLQINQEKMPLELALRVEKSLEKIATIEGVSSGK